MLGLLGSFHCVGMCGPIALILPLHKNNVWLKAIQIGLYFVGKTLTYGFLGCLFGFIGKGLFISEYQQNFSIFVGVIMVILGILSVFEIRFKGFQNTIFSGLTPLKSALGKQLHKKTFFTTLFIGFFNGFLPCGLVYTALFSALATANLSDTILYMVFFGIGTMPLMILVIYLGNFLGVSTRKYIQKIIPYAVILVGILFVFRGLGIGIPFISPTNNSLMIQENPECIVPLNH